MQQAPAARTITSPAGSVLEGVAGRLAHAGELLSEVQDELEGADFQLAQLGEKTAAGRAPAAETLRRMLPTLPELVGAVADQVKALEQAARA